MVLIYTSRIRYTKRLNNMLKTHNLWEVQIPTPGLTGPRVQEQVCSQSSKSCGMCAVLDSSKCNNFSDSKNNVLKWKSLFSRWQNGARERLRDSLPFDQLGSSQPSSMKQRPAQAAPSAVLHRALKLRDRTENQSSFVLFLLQIQEFESPRI